MGNYNGVIQQETTVVRTGGATNGTTPLSWNLSASANTSFYTPLLSDDIAIWNAITGVSKTATAHITTNTTLTNGDCWLEVEYLGSASSPLGSLLNSRAAVLGTLTALTAATSSTWGGSVANKYQISLAFTPQTQGVVKARLYLAKPSVTIYLDPLLQIV